MKPMTKADKARSVRAWNAFFATCPPRSRLTQILRERQARYAPSPARR